MGGSVNVAAGLQNTNYFVTTDVGRYVLTLFERLPAESLLDAVCAVTGQPEKFRGLPLGATAAQVAQRRGRWAEALGRARDWEAHAPGTGPA